LIDASFDFYLHINASFLHPVDRLSSVSLYPVALEILSVFFSRLKLILCDLFATELPLDLDFLSMRAR
jgi:hypothetical protein